MSISQQIRQYIGQAPFGDLITALHLLEAKFGTRAAIDQTLSRLCREGVIARVSRGLYAKPRTTNFGGRLLPNPEQIARAFAQLRGEPAPQMHGAEAARRFGLTMQMPSEITYLTPGSSREFSIGALRLKLEHAPHRHLLLAGSLAGEALSALFYLGQREADLEAMKRIGQQLPLEAWKSLLEILEELPRWLRRLLRRTVPMNWSQI